MLHLFYLDVFSGFYFFWISLTLPNYLKYTSQPCQGKTIKLIFWAHLIGIEMCAVGWEFCRTAVHLYLLELFLCNLFSSNLRHSLVYAWLVIPIILTSYYEFSLLALFRFINSLFAFYYNFYKFVDKGWNLFWLFSSLKYIFIYWVFSTWFLCVSISVYHSSKFLVMCESLSTRVWFLVNKWFFCMN